MNLEAMVMLYQSNNFCMPYILLAKLALIMAFSPYTNYTASINTLLFGLEAKVQCTKHCTDLIFHELSNRYTVWTHISSMA